MHVESPGDTPRRPAEVSVVINTYNRVDRIDGALAPLLRDGATLEVIFVDDGGSDGSRDLLRARAARDSRVRVVVTDNHGAGRARQTGAEHARGRFVLFLDDDVVAGEGMVSGHRARHGDRDDLLVVGYMPVAPAPPEGPDGWIADRYRAHYERHRRAWTREPDSILEHLWGGNLSVTRTTLRAMGGVYPGVRMQAHQDLVIGFRAADAGVSGVFAPELRAEHRFSRTVEAFCRVTFEQGYSQVQLRQLYPDRCGRLPARLRGVGSPRLTRRAYGVAAVDPVRRPLTGTLRLAVRWGATRRRPRIHRLAVRLLEGIEKAAGVRAGLRAHRTGRGPLTSPHPVTPEAIGTPPRRTRQPPQTAPSGPLPPRPSGAGRPFSSGADDVARPA